MQPILHHYDHSPFSEKIRLIFGLKGIAWRSVVIPDRLPKPDYSSLTGGYRRTPALQIGADVYCDSNLIALELERRWPAPTLFPQGRGLAQALAAWAERDLFWPAARFITGRNAAAFSPEFHADRAAMRNRPPPSLEQLRAAAARAEPELRVQSARLSDMLADGRAFLLGERPSLADFAAHHALWFLAQYPDTLTPPPPIGAWMARVEACGRGARREIGAEQAIEEARAAGLEPLAGERISVAPEDRASPPVEGVLVRLDDEQVTVRRMDPRAGAVDVHVPRPGYLVRAA